MEDLPRFEAEILSYDFFNVHLRWYPPVMVFLSVMVGRLLRCRRTHRCWCW
jgi:hypothetical protein